MRQPSRFHSGITLIEVMIAIAIFAIFLISFWEAPRAFHEFLEQSQNQKVCLMAKQALLRIRSASNLPPEIFRVPADKSVYLSHVPVPGSVRVYFNGHKIKTQDFSYEIGGRQIRFSSSMIGKTVVVNYAVPFLDWEKIAVVPFKKSHRIYLKNIPVLRVVSIERAEGNRLRELSPRQYQVNLKKGFIDFPYLGGKVVVVHYYGGKINGYLSGAFTSANLEVKTFVPTSWKFLQLRIIRKGGKDWIKFFTVKRS